MNHLMDSTIFTLDPEPLEALRILEDAGYEGWFVGGFVRDALLERPVHDIDIASSAPCERTAELFKLAGARVHETGMKHGTVTVVIGSQAFEITTYRSDGVYSDGRHPDAVRFVSSIEEDLARRDFTVNAMAYHPERGLLDPYGGLEDLKRGVIRCVGDPRKRFEEDALRILRACRFCSQLGFEMDAAAFETALCSKSLLRLISKERIYKELEGFLLGDFVHDALMADVDILSFVLPELVAMKECEQRTPYHIYDVLEHTAWVCQHSPATPIARWAALMHDMGKPAASFIGPDGVGHFYGHAAVSVELARGIMERLSFPNALRAALPQLIKRHDDVIPAQQHTVRRALNRLGSDPELFRNLCDLKRADALSQAPECAARVELADELERTLDGILEEGQAFSLKDLAIDGRDVLAAGVDVGPAVGALLQAALDAVMDDEVANEREALLEFVARAVNE